MSEACRHLTLELGLVKQGLNINCTLYLLLVEWTAVEGWDELLPRNELGWTAAEDWDTLLQKIWLRWTAAESSAGMDFC